MRTTPRFGFGWVAALAVALGILVGSTPSEAAIHIYRVSSSGKALFFPRQNSVAFTGYVIYDTVNPGNSVVIQLFRNKTYQIGSLNMAEFIFPSQVGVVGIDRSGNTVLDTAAALVAFTAGPAAHARAYIGVIPPRPFSLGNTFFSVARSLRGSGSITTLGQTNYALTADNFAVRDTWTLDALSGIPAVANSNSVVDGVIAVQAFLQTRRINQIP